MSLGLEFVVEGKEADGVKDLTVEEPEGNAWRLR
jgi:hypothetical protein